MKRSGTILVGLLALCIVSAILIGSAAQLIGNFIEMSMYRWRYEQSKRVFRMLEQYAKINILSSVDTKAVQSYACQVTDIVLPNEYSDPQIGISIRKNSNVEIKLSILFNGECISKDYLLIIPKKP